MFNSFITRLIENNRPIYCAVRLFSPQDRLAGANIAGAIETKLNEYTKEASNYVFLPYRDTNQSNIIEKDRAKRIYELDIHELNNCYALIARFDGLAKDSGIAMEIGYAFGRNIPIGVLLTDFIWEGLENTNDSWVVDPIIKLMSNCIVSFPEFKGIKGSYYQSNIEHEYTSINNFIEICFDKFSSHYIKPIDYQHGNEIYIDFMGGRYEWSKIMMKQIVESLQSANITSSINIPKRYSQLNYKEIEKAALKDIDGLLNSSIAVFCGDAPELEAGSASLLGLAKAKGIYIIYQYSSSVLYKGSGGQIMRGNLMLEQAADVVTKSLEDTISAIKYKLGETNYEYDQ